MEEKRESRINHMNNVEDRRTRDRRIHRTEIVRTITGLESLARMSHIAPMTLMIILRRPMLVQAVVVLQGVSVL